MSDQEIIDLETIIQESIEAGHKRHVTNVVHFWKETVANAIPSYMRHSNNEFFHEDETGETFARIPFKGELIRLFNFLWETILKDNFFQDAIFEGDYSLEDKKNRNVFTAPKGTFSRRLQDSFEVLEKMWKKYDLEWDYD